MAYATDFMTGGFSGESLSDYQSQMTELLSVRHDFTECVDVYDFRLCMRKDGSLYGTSGQCRKGSETDAQEKEVSRDEVLARKEFAHLKGKKRQTSNELLNKLSDEEFARVTSLASDVLLVKPSPKVGAMTPEMVEAIKSRADLLKRAANDPEALQSLFKPVSDRELDAAWSLLTPKLRNRASKETVEGFARNEGVTELEAKKQLFRRWMEQDGKDPYTGLPVNFIETELEHIRSLRSMGDESHSLKNLVWIQRDVNNSKLSSPLNEWVEKVKSVTPEEAAEKYRAAVQRTNKKGELKTRVKEDIKLLGEQADKLLKEYGIYSRYFLREAGFPVSVKQPEGNRNRGLSWMRTAKDENGRRVNMTKFIVKKLPVWTPRQLQEAIDIVSSITGLYSNGRITSAQANQIIYDELNSIR